MDRYGVVQIQPVQDIAHGSSGRGTEMVLFYLIWPWLPMRQIKLHSLPR